MSTENDRHVIATFDDRVKAQAALDALVDKGFDIDNLSLMVSRDGKDHHFQVDPTKSKTAEGVGYGAVLGGLVGGLGAVAAGLASVTIPGAIFVTGPLGAALAAGAAGATMGGIAGGLVGIGIPSDELELVEEELGRGNIVVAAHSIGSKREEIASETFKDFGAVRVH